MLDDLSLDSRVQTLENDLASLASMAIELQQARKPSLGFLRAGLVTAGAVVLIAAAPSGSRVKAPFTVVDDENRPIFSVESGTTNRGFYVYDASGSVTITGNVAGTTSYFKVCSPSISAAPTAPKKGRASRGGEARGGAPPKSQVACFDNIVMGVKDGTTPLVVLRTGGPELARVSMGVINGVASFNMGSNGLVNLTQGESGGLLQLGDPGGAEMAAFAVHAPGVGIVRAQPVGNAGVNVGKTAIIRGSGLPATFICGKGCAR